MAKYILIEANRLRGNQSYNNISEEQDIYKNKWINNIAPSGLVINTGDQLAIQDIIVNSRGASDDVMEIDASINENGFLDNKVVMEHSFYINHIARNTARMPFYNHSTYRGIGTVVAPTVDTSTLTGYQINAESGQALTPIQAFSIANMKLMLSRRSLGETFLPPSNIGGPQWDITKTYKLENYCAGSMLCTIETKTIGAGQSGVVNSGYVVGVYTTTTTQTPAASGMTIRINSVKEEEGIYGIIDDWDVVSLGTGYDGTAPVVIPNGGDGQPVLGTAAEFNVILFPDLDSYQSSDISPADGSRFYYANHDYTGLVNKMDASAAPDPDVVEASTMVETMGKRTQKVTLEAKGGFLTPDNLATLLTDQLHEPSRISRRNNIAPYIDLTNFTFNHRIPYQPQLSTVGNPVLIETPTYKVIPSNFDYTCIDGKATVAGARRGFYDGLAYKDADRFFAFKECFYNFNYGANNEITIKPSNDISSGTVGSDDCIWW